MRRDVIATDAQVLDITETEKYRQLNPQLPSAELRDLSATFEEFCQEGFDDVYVDDSPEELMEFFEAVETHERQDATDTDVSADHKLVEAVHDLDSPCMYGVHKTFGPAANDSHDDFDLEAALDVIL